MRAVDVDEVERDGHTGAAARLGDELIWDEMGRYLVKNSGHFESERRVSSQQSRRLVGHRHHV